MSGRQEEEPEAEPPDEVDAEAPGAHDAHLMDEDETETVGCAACGRNIWAFAPQCPYCGHAFAGEAWQAEPSQKRGWGLVALLTLLGFVLVYVLSA